MLPPNESVLSVPTEPSALMFDSILDGKWSKILGIILESGLQRDSDPVFDRAVQTFVQSFISDLPSFADDRNDSNFTHDTQNSPKAFLDRRQAEIAERIILFRVAKRISLSDAQFRELVRRSLYFWRNDHEKTVGIARLLPLDNRCAALLRTAGESVEQQVSGISVRDNRIADRADNSPVAVRSLFRSEQEKEFYQSVKAGYPQHLVCANVSLNAVIELDLIRHILSEREIRFFYRALLDTVVFDPKNDYLPVLAFELDSPLHDDALQRERDLKKDRILSAAGLRLVRIRPDRKQLGAKDFLALLRNANL